MSLKSFLSKFKKRQKAEDRLQEPQVEEKIIRLSAFKASVSTMVKDVPRDEYMFIEGFNRFDVKDGKTYTYHYIFKNIDEISCKVDKIICNGALVTVNTPVVDSDEVRYEKIINFITDDRGLTLREVRDKYFLVNGIAKEYSLTNTKFKNAYRMTEDNLLYNHYKDRVKLVNGRILDNEHYREISNHTETNVIVEVMRQAVNSEI